MDYSRDHLDYRGATWFNENIEVYFRWWEVARSMARLVGPVGAKDTAGSSGLWVGRCVVPLAVEWVVSGLTD